MYQYLTKGWPREVESSLSTYAAKKSELTVEGGCILWGVRVIIPTKWRKRLLLELHRGHLQNEEYCERLHVVARYG